MKKKKPSKVLPKKKAHGLPATQVEFFRKKLDALRDDLNRTMGKKREEAMPDSEVGDEGDVAAQSVARDLVFEQTDNEKRLLDEVEAAHRRVEKNVFGLCESCGAKIKIIRLKFMPYARYCIKCQARFEHV